MKNTRLIDADEFIDHLKKTSEVNNDQFSELEKGLTFLVDAYATFKEVDAVHVINCRECRWLKTNEFYTYCPITKHYGLDSNTYCCWAERKEYAKVQY